MVKRTDSIDAAYAAILKSWRKQGKLDRSALAEALQNYRIAFSYNSGKMENAQITYHDTRDVFESGRVVSFTGNTRTLFEIQNLKECHERMLDALQERAPLDEKLVLSFHYTLTKGTYDEKRWSQGERPGAYKMQDYVVGVNNAGARAEDVPNLVRELCKELDAATEDSILTVAAYFHLVFEHIHPFADGNGRCGRALMNYLLLFYRHPPIIVFEEDRMAYYGAMETWDTEATLDSMRDFIKAETVKTWMRELG